jgi:hypothetical protein
MISKSTALLSLVILSLAGMPPSAKSQAHSRSCVGTPRSLYTSPTGRSGGMGTRSDPLDLATGLARVGPTTVLELLGGVYHVSNSARLTLGGRGDGQNIIRAASGERPIVTKNNGYPPTVFVNNKTRVEGIWFGGTTDTTNMPFIVNNDDEIVGCVFWGYYGCINDASKHNLFEDNLFVNCGRGDYYHAIYISGLSPSWDSCTTVRRNIFIGGEGYAIHLWHAPTYVKVDNNFVANGQRCIASDGIYVVVRDNIFWSNTLQPTMLIAGNIVLEHNLIGRKHTHYQYRDPRADLVTADRNAFVESAEPGGPFGAHVIRIQEKELATITGVGASEIDGAITALERTFTSPPATLVLDTSIVANRGILFHGLDSWMQHR